MYQNYVVTRFQLIGLVYWQRRHQIQEYDQTESAHSTLRWSSPRSLNEKTDQCRTYTKRRPETCTPARLFEPAEQGRNNNQVWIPNVN